MLCVCVMGTGKCASINYIQCMCVCFSRREDIVYRCSRVNVMYQNIMHIFSCFCEAATSNIISLTSLREKYNLITIMEQRRVKKTARKINNSTEFRMHLHLTIQTMHIAHSFQLESWEIMIILRDEIDSCILVQFSAILTRRNAIWYCIWNPFSYTDHKNAWEMSLKSLLKTARLISLWIAANVSFFFYFSAQSLVFFVLRWHL